MAYRLPPPNFYQPNTTLQISRHTDSGLTTTRNSPLIAAPDQPGPGDWRIRQVIAILTEDLSQDHTIEELAAQVGLSASRLAHVFKAETGLSPLQYLRQLRLRTALRLLETTSLSVKEIRHKVGVSDQSHFTRDVKKYCGLTPARYRRHCQGAIPGQ